MMKKRFAAFALMISLTLIALTPMTVIAEGMDATSAATVQAWTEQAFSGTPTVRDIYELFNNDEEAARAQYRSEPVVASGVVLRTGADIHGTPSVELSDVAGGQRYATYVVRSYDQLSEIEVGSTVTMTGMFHIVSASEWGVVMKQSELVKQPEAAVTGDSNMLIIYYSQSGTTDSVAQAIQARTGADLFRMETVEPYTSDVGQEMQAERDSGSFRPLKDNLPDLSNYDVILVGGPVWSGIPSNPVQVYLNNTDFGDKPVAGFWTCYGTPADYANAFASMVQGGNIKQGLSLTHADLSPNVLNEQIDAWLAEVL